MRSWLSGLSPRRRVLVLAVAGLVTVPLAVLAGTGLSDRLRDVPAQDRPGAVVLIPGYGGNTGSLEGLAGRIRAGGRTATVVDLPDGGTGDLARQADAVEDAVASLLRAGAPSVDVVGYSAGGVVARLWVQRHDGVHKARRVVTLGSPHHGTRLAAAGVAAAPGACPTACQQLAAGSRLLAGLDTPVPRPPAWLSVWTTQDQTVTPPDSARLEGAVNVAVQDLCPGRAISHSQLPGDPVVAGMVLGAIGPQALTEPVGCVSS
jgi:pimeloyl-ACP methyl ester carboxylesterase